MGFAKVYVIIVWYNGAKWVTRNIQSLLNSNIPVQIICIDNCSTDQTETLLKQFPQITYIKAPSNLGFGKANNIGIDLALKQQADYVFLLNQDTWIYPETIENLVNAAKQNPEYGIVSPIHLAPNETDWDLNFKTYFDRATFAENKNLVEVPFVNAAAWLIPYQALQKVSYFEPLYGHYGEDRNFADRMLFHNFKIAVATNAKITHDRMIVRNFNKDIIQCQYKILSILLDPNKSEKNAKREALKNVIGLPKYFYKFYGFKKAFSLFLNLNSYYKAQMQNWEQLKKARSFY